jgi:hypothetical protein
MSRLLQGSSRILQVDTSSTDLGASGIFFMDSSKIEINENQFFESHNSRMVGHLRFLKIYERIKRRLFLGRNEDRYSKLCKRMLGLTKK